MQQGAIFKYLNQSEKFTDLIIYSNDAITFYLLTGFVRIFGGNGSGIIVRIISGSSADIITGSLVVV